MSEIPSVGFTEEDYRSSQVDRRSLLKLPLLMAVAELAAACSPRRVEPARPVAVEASIRRELGVWTKTDISRLSQSMIQEDRLSDIVYAGRLLGENLNGRRSVSIVTDLFVDEPIIVQTVRDVAAYEGRTSEKKVPMVTIIETFGPSIPVTLRSKKTGATTQFSSKGKLQLREIAIDKDGTADFSDRVFKILFSKEFYNAKAFHMVLAFSKSQGIDPEYTYRDDDTVKRAIIVGRLLDEIEDIPVTAVIDNLAHCLVTPDYLTAVDEGLITPGDWGERNDIENSFKIPGGKLFKDGVLTKDDEGYHWTKDTNRIFDALLYIATHWGQEL